MPDTTLETKLTETLVAINTFKAKADEEIKLHGVMLAETKTNFTSLQSQLDAIDQKLVDNYRLNPVAQKSIVEVLKENEDVSRLIRDKKGRSVIFTLSGDQVSDLMGQKTTITTGGAGYGLAAPGVVNIERLPGIVVEARRRLRIRQLLNARPTTSPLIYYVKVLTPLAEASPQAEATTKAENALNFFTVTAQVQTIATFIPASRQILEDFSELEGFLRSSLPYYVNRAEERQLLAGDGTGNNLNGLVTQASVFNAGLLSANAGWTRIDQIGAAAEQVDIIDEIPSTWVTLNPRDWWNLRRTKDSLGRYILGDPQAFGNPTIWDLNVVSTTAMASGTFLVGNSDPAASEIRDRMEMQFDISTEDVDNFRKNMVTIRAEKRLALIVSRPQSFIAGSFATSPAGM